MPHDFIGQSTLTILELANRPGSKARRLVPGMLLSAVIAMAASFLSEHYGGPAMLFALLLGIAFNYLSTDSKASAGVAFSSKAILRLGVALLGVRITFGEIQSLGLETIALVVGGVTLTIVIGYWLGRGLSQSAGFSILSAGAVAICGASAALAISSVLPKTDKLEQQTIITVVGVTSLSTLAMMIYPIIVGLIGMSDTQAGLFIGATIHDVAQVVGAGYTISPEAGDTSAIVKLLRVCCLLPAVVGIGLVFGRGARSVSKRPPVVPWFLLVFVGLVVVNSLGWIPAVFVSAMSTLSSSLLLMAVAALGVRTSLQQLADVGPKPLLALTLQTGLLAAFVVAALLLIR